MPPTTTIPALERLTVTDTKTVEDSDSSSTYATPVDEPSQAATLAPTAQTPISSSAATREVPTGKIRVPFEHPAPGTMLVPRPEPNADQANKYAEVLKAVSSWTELPTSAAKNASTAPLSDDERVWLSRECLLRYLRASSWNVTGAIKRLQDTLVWRREYDIKAITADLVSVESETGKQHVLGFDNNQRSCLYMTPARQNTQKSERQIQHLVYMLERTIDMLPPGQETTTLLINFRGATSGGSPSVSQGKQVLNILQSHYPERLGRACISDLPWYINTFFKLVSPFIDPVTKEKMIFNQDLRNYIPPAQLDKDHGGDADFEYDHSIYWPALDKMCTDRRAAVKERWVKAGSHIGEYEDYLRGGSRASLSAEKA